jgi:hypothetical protein
MQEVRVVNEKQLENITWGMLFILWGVSIFFDAIPFGVGIAGTGLILLGLNAVRALNAIPMGGATTVCGILALAWGALELLRPIAGPVLHLPFALNDWAIFSILLALLGAIFVGAGLLRRPDVHSGRSVDQP